MVQAVTTQSHPRPPYRGLESLKPAAFCQVLVPGSTSCGQDGEEVGTKPREFPVIPFSQKEALGLKATFEYKSPNGKSGSKLPLSSMDLFQTGFYL